MSYNVSFISLGCAKNQVNCEQMMALCAEAGYSIQAQPEGCDVVVVNTCGFLASACEEAIENILEMAELEKAGQVKKILVTGCMTQRYKEDIFHELPEVDGLLGTGSYGDIATAIAEVMEKGEKPCHLGNIHTANQSGERILSTPPWYAYLRIAEGCDNHCAYCVIPSLRGKYRSRPMNELLDEAAELASAGVKELIVIAQDITRYGTDLNGEHQLAKLLKELCKPLPLPHGHHRRADRRDRQRAEDREVSGYSHPALQRYHFKGHEPPGHQGGPAGPAEKAAGEGSRSGAADQPHCGIALRG